MKMNQIFTFYVMFPVLWNDVTSAIMFFSPHGQVPRRGQHRHHLWPAGGPAGGGPGQAPGHPHCAVRCPPRVRYQLDGRGVGGDVLPHHLLSVTGNVRNQPGGHPGTPHRKRQIFVPFFVIFASFFLALHFAESKNLWCAFGVSGGMWGVHLCPPPSMTRVGGPDQGFQVDPRGEGGVGLPDPRDVWEVHWALRWW